jgi:hypothetical protein
MQLAQPHAECSIVNHGLYVRAYVGPVQPSDVLDCYRTLVVAALEQKFTHVLVVGEAVGDPMSHLAARDAVIAFADIGVPAGFKLAFVPRSYDALNGYRHAEIEAAQRGIRAKIFSEEDEAVHWLTAPECH